MKDISLYSYINSSLNPYRWFLSLIVSLSTSIIFALLVLGVKLNSDFTMVNSLSPYLATLVESSDRPEILRVLQSVSKSIQSDVILAVDNIVLASNHLSKSSMEDLDRPLILPPIYFNFIGRDITKNEILTKADIRKANGDISNAKMYILTPITPLLSNMISIFFVVLLTALSLSFISSLQMKKAIKTAIIPMAQLHSEIKDLINESNQVSNPIQIRELEEIRNTVLSTKIALDNAKDQLAESKAKKLSADAYKRLIHDLHNPVSALRQMASLANDESQDFETKTEAAKSIPSLADQILSQVKAAKQNLEQEPIALRDLNILDCIKESIHQVQSLKTQKSISECFQNELMNIPHDPILLKRAIVNLLENGVDAARSQVRISLLRTEQNTIIRVCDDDSDMLQTLNLSLRSSFEVTTANIVEKAKKLILEKEFDAAVIDLNFEGQELDGIHLLDFMTKHSAGTFLIVLSGDTSTRRIVEATRRKHFQFIIKDDDYFPSLLKSLTNATQLKMAQNASNQIKYLTQSDKVKTVLRQVDTIIRSNSEAPILILGETGTGKEFLAQHISLNLKMKTVTANMGCIPKEMAESILFGHERGAFTGAFASKTGLIETAHNGLFFLDEIGECSASVQSKLLRVIQEKEVQALGSNKTKKINVRFIAATHQDLNKQVSEGTFRLDLLQRLNTFVLKLPSLRERPEDIIFYANLFINDLSRDTDRFHLTPDGENELLSYQWKGNIRELRNVIERIVVLSSKKSIDKTVVAEAIGYGLSPNDTKITRADIVESNARKEEVIKTLNEFNGSKRKTALSLGISEATLYRWLKEFNLNKTHSTQAFRQRFEAFT